MRVSFANPVNVRKLETFGAIVDIGLLTFLIQLICANADQSQVGEH